MNKKQNNLSTTVHYIETFLEEHFGKNLNKCKLRCAPRSSLFT